jgi:hypothetical protein
MWRILDPNGKNAADCASTENALWPLPGLQQVRLSGDAQAYESGKENINTSSSFETFFATEF